MMRTTPHLRARSAAWILAVALVFGCIAEAGPAVLCIGDDGHTDVEYSLAGCCIPVTDAREQKVLQPANSGGPECDDCVDLGLEQNILKAGKRLLPAPEANLLRFYVPKRRAGGTKMAPAAPRSAHESVTSELSSIVLLV